MDRRQVCTRLAWVRVAIWFGTLLQSCCYLLFSHGQEARANIEDASGTTMASGEEARHMSSFRYALANLGIVEGLNAGSRTWQVLLPSW